MASTLPSVEGCCTPCVEPVSVAVPGPQGAAGAAGTNGTNGVNAFTTITGGAAVMPAEGANVTLAVVSSAWMSATEVVYIESRGYMEVQSKPNTTSVILKNLANTAASTYLANSPPGTVFTAALGVSPGGLQGPAGINGTSGAPTTSTYILKTPDGALASAQALSILATGYMKSAFATGAVTTQAVPIPIVDGGTGAITAAAALTALAAAPSNATFITQVAEAGLSAEQSLASLPTGYVKVTTATGVLGSTAVPIPIADGGTGGITAAAARTALGVLSGYGLLGSVAALNLNSATTDTAITLVSARYRIDRVTLESPSAAVTLATAGLFTAAGGGGVTLCADQALAATLTSTSKFQNLTQQAITGTDTRTEGTLYARVGTAEGAARTVNLKIYGWAFDAV